MGHCNCLVELERVCSNVDAILFAVEAGVRMVKSKTYTSVPLMIIITIIIIIIIILVIIVIIIII